MALPTLDRLKAELRIETDIEDDLLEDDLKQAYALVEADIRRPILARAVTIDLDPIDANVYGVGTRLMIPHAPISASGIVVEDADGVEVDSSTYTVHAGRGWITAASGSSFSGLHRVTVTTGLSLLPDYDLVAEPAISRAILDHALDLYQRRNPAASYESSGGGIATNYNETANKTQPSRIKVNLDKWRRIIV